MRQPCLDCGVPADGTRCGRCRTTFTHIRNRTQTQRRRAGLGANRPYDATYRKTAKIVRENAERCWLCGDGFRVDDPWTADHIEPGRADSALAPAHRSCNSARANKMRSKKRS